MHERDHSVRLMHESDPPTTSEGFWVVRGRPRDPGLVEIVQLFDHSRRGDRRAAP
jgi:hypothetical protein